MKITLLAGLALACAALSGCNSLGGLTGNPIADVKSGAIAANPQQFAADLKAFNSGLGDYCTGDGNFDWNPPLPPSGSLHARCAFGKPAAAATPSMLFNPFTGEALTATAPAPAK